MEGKMFNLRNGNILESEKNLYDALKDYKWLMSNEAYSYLEALIALEVSALDSKTPDEQREVLKKLDLYKKIAIYNICMRSRKLLVDNAKGINLSFIENFVHPVEYKIYGNVNGRSFPVFAFDIEQNNPFYIGDTDIYFTQVNDEARRNEIERLTKKIEEEKNKDNPYAIHDGIIRTNEEDASRWEADCTARIARMQKSLDGLAKFAGLSKKEEEVMIAKNTLGNILLSDINLKEEDFKPIQEEGMKRTLTKKYPGMSVHCNINNL